MRGQLARPVLRGARVSNDPRLLDSMRLRHIEQMAPKVASVFWEVDSIIASTIEQKVPRIRHQMWNGKWQAAMHRMRDIYRGTRATAEYPQSADGDREWVKSTRCCPS